ncbi:hypothetical protein SLEP1_g22049 [Rubroshorea leprosula]|uniref:Uncharacterized protein n=1 Tax=Rubroshorea leprosula TaxID=152421 RepID=A0AAV5JIT8_9ROSI|nr:hypothetical protein SLEP1_g22049 [Rubroshorea leprosula]
MPTFWLFISFFLKCWKSRGFQLPRSSSRWKKKLYLVLCNKLKLPGKP